MNLPISKYSTYYQLVLRVRLGPLFQEVYHISMFSRATLYWYNIDPLYDGDSEDAAEFQLTQFQVALKPAHFTSRSCKLKSVLSDKLSPRTPPLISLSSLVIWL